MTRNFYKIFDNLIVIGCISVFFLSSFSPIYSQDGKKAVLPDSEVDVIKEFDATLEDAERMSLNPSLLVRDTSSKKYQYKVSSYNLKIPYFGPNIRPLSMPVIPQDPGWPGYIKLGIGYPLSSSGTLAYNYIGEDRFSINAMLNHQASYKSELENQRYMMNDLLINSKYIASNKLAIGTDIGYGLHDFYLYGYDHDVQSYTLAESLRRYYNPKIDLSIFSPTMSENGWKYKLGLNISRLSDNQASKENNFLGHLRTSKTFKNKHQLDLGIGADFSRFTDTINQKLDNFYFNPAFIFAGTKFQFRAGLNLMSSQDIYYLFPDARMSAQLIANQLIFELGAGGGLRKNNFEELATINPYVNPMLPELKNTLSRNYYGRAKGVYKSLVYSLEGGFIQNNDFAFYQNKPSDSRYFDVSYDSLNITYFQTQIQTVFLPELSLDAKLRYNIYAKHSFEKAWYLPNLECDFILRYTALEKKLQTYFNLSLESPLAYEYSNNTTTSSAWLADISIGADYYLFEQFSLFLEGNNLLNNKRARWQYYPSYGINVMGGIKSRF